MGADKTRRTFVLRLVHGGELVPLSDYEVYECEVRSRGAFLAAGSRKALTP